MPEPLFTHLGQGGADDQRVASFQDSLVPQMIQRGQELPTRQIAGRTDDDKRHGAQPDGPTSAGSSVVNRKMEQLAR